jgi:hypothetical protein
MTEAGMKNRLRGIGINMTLVLGSLINLGLGRLAKNGNDGIKNCVAGCKNKKEDFGGIFHNNGDVLQDTG